MKILLLNQAFHPDVVATSQYASDLAVELIRAGHEVTVIASRRAYDKPKKHFPSQETWRGVRIVRVACTGMGKRKLWHRAVDFASFLAMAAMRLTTLPKVDVVVAMTSPPLICLLGALYARATGARLVLWMMDLNPDQAIAAGCLNPQSKQARLLAGALRYSLNVARYVVVLDRFMKSRILDKGVREDQVSVVPPWSQDESVGYDPVGRDAFRTAHGLQDKFVVMYAGNHSPCHPLDTLLEAAERSAYDTRIAFCFVGGGSEFSKVQQFAAGHGLENIVCLPYQPLEQLAAPLSAADLHVVVMGDPFVGIIHPCKVYNVLANGSPVLYIGPEESHVSDLGRAGLGYTVHSARHGEVSKVLDHLEHCAKQVGRRRVFANSAPFSQRHLVPMMIQILDSAHTGLDPKPLWVESHSPETARSLDALARVLQPANQQEKEKSEYEQTIDR